MRGRHTKIPINILVVSKSNGLQFPFTSALCSSEAEICPDLSSSTVKNQLHNLSTHKHNHNLNPTLYLLTVDPRPGVALGSVQPLQTQQAPVPHERYWTVRPGTVGAADAAGTVVAAARTAVPRTNIWYSSSLVVCGGCEEVGDNDVSALKSPGSYFIIGPGGQSSQSNA